MTLTVVKTTALTGTITNAQLAGGIDLTSKVTGTLPIANGGTNSTATTFVNATTNITGALPIVNGGTGSTTFAPGKIGQVLQTTGYTAQTNSTTYASYLTQAITPSATSSKILIFHQAPSMIYLNNTSNMGHVAIFRDSTNITTAGHGSSLMSYQAPNSRSAIGATSCCWLDSPSSTSSITYSIQVKVDNAALTMVYGWASSQPRVSTITCMEVLA
tara:strand:+ start:114 stop:761 length:648 start_codon:yes stop_codon:yes gene_type:complete